MRKSRAEILMAVSEFDHYLKKIKHMALEIFKRNFLDVSIELFKKIFKFILNF